MCAVRVIAESEIIQDFLTESEEDISSSPLVELKVMVNAKGGVLKKGGLMMVLKTVLMEQMKESKV